MCIRRIVSGGERGGKKENHEQKPENTILAR